MELNDAERELLLRLLREHIEDTVSNKTATIAARIIKKLEG